MGKTFTNFLMTNTFMIEEPVFIDEDANNYVGLKFSSTNELQVTMKHTIHQFFMYPNTRKITKQRFEDGIHGIIFW